MRPLHIVTISPDVPNPGLGGGGNWGSILLKHFKAAGHRVTHIGVVGKHAAIHPERPWEAAAESYRAIGIETVLVPYRQAVPPRRSILERMRKFLVAEAGDFFPSEIATRPDVHSAIRALQPDIIVAFAFDAILYSEGIGIPRLGIMAEGPHVNARVTRRYSPAIEPGFSIRYYSYMLVTALQADVLERIAAKTLRKLTVPAFIAEHYVQWAHRRRMAQAVFMAIPTPAPVSAHWAELQQRELGRNRKTRIMFIGHLHSTSNRSGLPLLFEEILPTLEAEWGSSAFEIRMVGRNDHLPARFDRFRTHPNVVWCGAVFPADSEFVNADVLLVPIPAETGPRVRVLNGWSFGCCVVAHRNNALGIAEMRHEENCLMAGDGQTLARLVMRAAGDPALRRRLGAAGRRVFEERYSEAVGARACLDLVAKATADHHSAPSALDAEEAGLSLARPT